MALINCPECSHSISDQSLSCPKCGYVNSTKNRVKNNLLAKESQISRPQEKMSVLEYMTRFVVFILTVIIIMIVILALFFLMP